MAILLEPWRMPGSSASWTFDSSSAARVTPSPFIAVTDLDNDGELDLAVFEGVESGLLDHDDLAAAAALVRSSTAVGVLVYENTWAGPFVTAMTQAGAQLLASVRIPATDVISALDSLEAQPA